MMARAVRVMARRGAVWSGRALLDHFLAAGARLMAWWLRGMAQLASVRMRGGGRWRVSWRAGMAGRGSVARERACTLWSRSGFGDSGAGADEAVVLGVHSCRGQHGEWRWCPGLLLDTLRRRGAGSSWLAAWRGKTPALRCSPLKRWLELGDTRLGAVVLGGRGRGAGDQGVDRGEREGAAPPWCAVNSLCLFPVHQVFDEMLQ